MGHQRDRHKEIHKAFPFHKDHRDGRGKRLGRALMLLRESKEADKDNYQGMDVVVRERDGA